MIKSALIRSAFFLALLFSVTAHADLRPIRRCEALTDSQRLARADIAGLGEITKVSCTCARTPSCSYTVALSTLKKGDAGKITFTEYSRLRSFMPSECTRLQREADLRLGTSEYFYFRKTATGYTSLDRRNCPQY